MKKLTLVLKNNYLFFIAICFIQTFVEYFRSSFLGSTLNNFNLGRNLKLPVIFLSSLIVVIVVEMLPNYLSGRENSKKLVLNNFFLDFAYSVTRILSPLKFFLKEKKNIFTYDEQDLIRFINNLTSKEILLLEPSEAKLVNLAFNMDDKDITNVMIPMEETACLNSSMKMKDVTNFCLERGLTKYPVYDNNQKIIGVFSTKSLIFPLLERKKITNWKAYINEKVAFLEYTTKLSVALENLKKSRNYLALVKRNNVIIGIVTLKDILGSLVGKIQDETN